MYSQTNVIKLSVVYLQAFLQAALSVMFVISDFGISLPFDRFVCLVQGLNRNSLSVPQWHSFISVGFVTPCDVGILDKSVKRDCSIH